MKKRKQRHSPLIVFMLVVITFIVGFYSGKTFGLTDIEGVEAGTHIRLSENIQLDSYADKISFIAEPIKQNTTIDVLLINDENPLPRGYLPVDLINLYEQRNRHFQLAKSDISICRVVFEAMDSMFCVAQIDGVDGFIITSGYRTFEEQSELYFTRADGTAARPGTSEHETGLAFDVTAMGDANFALTPQFEWLSQNCGEYGFILRYLDGAEGITGTPYEPWHYRYVGLPYSKTIMDDGITLEEYLSR